MSTFRRFAVGVAAALVVIVTAAPPAAAHDELVSSTPASHARLDTAPGSVSLQFSADVMELGALIMVADTAGGDWVTGDPTVQGNIVTVPIAEGMPVGGYEVRWRVVSADGHPISGVIPFTVGDAEPLQRQSSDDVVTGDAGSVSAEQPQDSQSTQENGGVLRVALIGAAGAAVAVAVGAAIQFLRRRQTAAGVDDASSSKHS